MPFSLSRKALDHYPLRKKIISKDSGAISIFVGRVRQTNRGHRVKSLVYESIPEMTLSQGRKIIKAVKDKYKLQAIGCIQRVGTCRPGEITVILFVSAAHRREALYGCREAINQLKKNLPIWKKEIYAGQGISKKKKTR